MLLERFVFDGGREGRWARLGWYALMNNIWNVASVPVMYAITTGFGVAHLWANWFVISGMTVVRFAISNRLIWRGARHRDRPGGHGADAAAEHLVLRHPRHRADRVGDAAARARAVRGAGVAGRARHRGDGQQPWVRRAPPQGERHRSRRRRSPTSSTSAGSGSPRRSTSRPSRASRCPSCCVARRTSRTPTWSSPWCGGSWCARATSSRTPPACRSTVTAC